MTGKTIIDGVEVPTSAAADWAIRAASVGISVGALVGIMALSGAYGRSHPAVRAFIERSGKGESGPETKRDAE